ncbi:hypothetical protein [Agromyces sp. M3QZ16-3]|uniref:hypothetical protein n=1 Tax=Agromyces sp. M3QZ16-3 TaxID=3447585 RepID=UPI003F68C821
MDEDDFEKTRDAEPVAQPREHTHPGQVTGERTAFGRPSRTALPHRQVRRDLLGDAPEHPGIIWVRASDLLNTGTGRVAGHGLDLETELARRVRRTAGATRRAIRERADRLPPLSAFGRSQAHPTFIRHDLGRH